MPPGRLRRAGFEAARTLAAIIVVFAIFDLSLRAAYAVRSAALDRVVLPYVLGHKYGPLPPWVDGVRILEDDPVLLWRGRSNVLQTYVDVFSAVAREEERTRLLRQFVPRVPASIEDNPTWTVELNSEGFRGPELPAAKAPGTFRVVCLGDSWTFGVGVDEAETYPRRLEALLRLQLGRDSVEVLNLGVMGYTSLQGLRLLRTRGLELEPDLVVIAFAMNDSSVPGYRDKDVAAPTSGPSLSSRLAKLVEHIEFYKLLRYAVAIARYEPEPLGDRIASAQRRIEGETGPTDYSELEAWTRVSPVDYDINVREMIELARARGTDVVLVYNEFLQESPYRRALLRVSNELGVPLVDTSVLLDTELAAIQTQRERSLAVSHASVERMPQSDHVEAVFRVLSHEGQVSIVSPHPALGAGEPNRVTMRDDGVAPDERAGDGIWTHSVTLEPATRLVYVYTRGATPGQWEGLDVPAFRRFLAPGTPSRQILPVETFGAIDLKTDSWHTNARGNELIGAALAGKAAASERLRADPRQKMQETRDFPNTLQSPR